MMGEGVNRAVFTSSTFLRDGFNHGNTQQGLQIIYRIQVYPLTQSRTSINRPTIAVITTALCILSTDYKIVVINCKLYNFKITLWNIEVINRVKRIFFYIKNKSQWPTPNI